MRLRYSDVTPEPLYLSRRELMVGAAALAAHGRRRRRPLAATPPAGAPLKATPNPAYRVADPPTKIEAATTYNNFYEFGTNKDDPARLAGSLKPRPWHVQVDGLCAKPKTFDIEEILKIAPLEERIYSLRCVEAWSMVIPWIGYSLAALAQEGGADGAGQVRGVHHAEGSRAVPRPEAGASSVGSLDWPYTEGLRLDEAMHPLTLLTLGMYGQVLPNQNGAPVRIVIPWKYGFKSAKSIVRIRLTDTEPEDGLEQGGAPGVRLLLERQPGRRSSALEPGHRAAHR